jgi:hypothetical protein
MSERCMLVKVGVSWRKNLLRHGLHRTVPTDKWIPISLFDLGVVSLFYSNLCILDLAITYILRDASSRSFPRTVFLCLHSHSCIFFNQSQALTNRLRISNDKYKHYFIHNSPAISPFPHWATLLRRTLSPATSTCDQLTRTLRAQTTSSPFVNTKDHFVVHPLVPSP